MSDKLTLQLIEDLYKKNEETNALNDPSLNQINQQSISLYDQLSKQDTEEVISSDKKSGIIQGGGALLWNILDSALVGVPGIAAKKAGADISYSRSSSWIFSSYEIYRIRSKGSCFRC